MRISSRGCVSFISLDNDDDNDEKANNWSGSRQPVVVSQQQPLLVVKKKAAPLPCPGSTQPPAPVVGTALLFQHPLARLGLY